MEPDKHLAAHLELLARRLNVEDIDEIRSTPLFTPAARDSCIRIMSGVANPFPQYGLLGGDVQGNARDPRVFYNTSAPSSVFICGSQGSGKSHTLGCLLENCLVKSVANTLENPLTGIVFHYDSFVSEKNGSPCEAAYLASSMAVKVRVLCAPTNVRAIKEIYRPLPNVTVETLKLGESDLDTKRMLDLMAVNGSGPVPLYVHVVGRILREMRIQQQVRESPFNYQHFLRMIDNEDLTPGQKVPLQQRLDTLQSFMVGDQVKPGSRPAYGTSSNFSTKSSKGNDWAPEAGRLTIIDLSCPCITPEMACSLFNISLSLFLEQPTTIGRVIALDEAHKYMTDSTESKTLTKNLLSCVRLQRHIAARIFIATQEPTVAPTLLDLCSVTIVHRFTSPDWLATLKQHIAGVSTTSLMLKRVDDANVNNLVSGLSDLSLAYEPDSSSVSSSNSSLVNLLTRIRPTDSPNKQRQRQQEEEENEAKERVQIVTLDQTNPSMDLFCKIVSLRVGEALVFAPSAVLDVKQQQKQQLDGNSNTNKNDSLDIKRLDHGILKLRIRGRVTQDGGKSIMAD